MRQNRGENEASKVDSLTCPIRVKGRSVQLTVAIPVEWFDTFSHLARWRTRRRSSGMF